MYIHTHTHTHTCIQGSIYVYTNAYICAYTYIYTYICTHIYIYLHNSCVRRLCDRAAASLPWKLLRTYFESCANIVQAVLCHPPSCRPDKACGTPTQYIAVCCSVLWCVAVCCSFLQRVAVCYSGLQCVAVCCRVLQFFAVCCSVLQCVALQWVAVFGSVLQRVLASIHFSAKMSLAKKDWQTRRL